MARVRTSIAGWCLIGMAVGLCRDVSATEKKLIAVGWAMPNAEQLREVAAAMEGRPFRGSSLRFTGRNGTPFLDFAHSREKWKPEDIDQITEDLAAARPKRLTDCFLDVKATPGDVDWFDDEGWAIIVDHWRAAARVAREGGIAGLLFDPESYDNAQFGYQAQAEAEQHSFDEYRRMARQRGREVMSAVAEEYPDITIFSLFMLSIFQRQAGHPSLALAVHRYGLYPAFIDGWLDAAPASVTLVDGCESAYRFNSDVEYLAAANAIRNTCQHLVSPENRYKYRAQVQVSFGVYADAYVNPPDSPWYIDPGDQTPLQRFETNLASALNAADEYVWLYGEQASWWARPDAEAGAQGWSELLPGIEEVLWSVTEPAEHAARLLAEAAEETTGLVTNGDFSAETADAPEGVQADDWVQEGAPGGWSFWQSAAAESEGNPGWDPEVGHDAPGSATMRTVRKGCLIQSIAVASGERYAAAAWHRVEGAGVPSVRIRWQKADGSWHAEHEDCFLTAHGAAGQWQRMVGLVRVPEGAGRLVLLLSVDGQRSDQDVVWWDDVVVFRID